MAYQSGVGWHTKVEALWCSHGSLVESFSDSQVDSVGAISLGQID